MRWRRRSPPPAVSIVVATHNRASLLSLALNSALGQDYPNLEVLVMDDGSTDDTAEVLAGYAGRLAPERFRFESHANMGQARTLNRGYELARGELIGYLSDDDLVAPKLVSTLARALAETPDAAGAYPAYRLIDAEGAVIDTTLPLLYTPTTALCNHDTIIGPGGLARRGALEASGAWDPRFHWIGDLVMWMGVARSGPILRVPEPLASWRKHPEGATSAIGWQRAAEHLSVFERGLTLDHRTAENPELRAEALRNACIVASWFAGHMHFAPGEPIMMIDQNRPLISAWASGQDPATSRFDLGHAERLAAALRRLGELTLELAEERDADPGPAGPHGGYERAVKRLQTVGALAGPDGNRAGLNQDAVGAALIAAALDCAAEVPVERRRYLMPDRDKTALAATELSALAELTLSGPAHGRGIIAAVRTEIERREQDLADVRRAAGRPRPVV